MCFSLFSAQAALSGESVEIYSSNQPDFPPTLFINSCFLDTLMPSLTKQLNLLNMSKLTSQLISPLFWSTNWKKQNKNKNSITIEKSQNFIYYQKWQSIAAHSHIKDAAKPVWHLCFKQWLKQLMVHVCLNVNSFNMPIMCPSKLSAFFMQCSKPVELKIFITFRFSSGCRSGTIHSFIHYSGN